MNPSHRFYQEYEGCHDGVCATSRTGFIKRRKAGRKRQATPDAPLDECNELSGVGRVPAQDK